MTFVTALLETLCFSGIIYGWGSMSYILKDQGYFSSKCNKPENLHVAQSTTGSTDESTCKVQEVTLNLVFTISSVISSALIIISGYILDKFGTRMVRLSNVVLYVTGWLVMALTTWKQSWTVFISMILISISGFSVVVSNIPVANFFPVHRALVIAVINGAFDSSAMIFALIKIAYDHGVNFYSILFFMAGCGAIMVVRFLFLMPKMNIPYNVPEDFQYGLQCCIKNEIEVSPDVTEVSRLLPGEANTPDLKSCILNVSFILNILHVGILQLRNQFFYGTVDSWLNQFHDTTSPSETSYYLNAFGIFQLCGILVSPLGGLITDFCIQRFSLNSTEQVATRRAVATYIGISSVLATLFSIVVLIPVLPLQYLSFFLQVTFRSSLYGGNASFLLTLFPGKHFGKLYGITILFACIIAILQYPLFVIVTRIFDQNFTVINIVLLAASAITIVHPIILFVRPLSTKRATEE
uniref:Major facilitator superfamily (MFS) profile domain-containing protein n=1 Tax=Ciona savignyi TaxID=51511 RepID=H2YAF6_CIOSA